MALEIKNIESKNGVDLQLINWEEVRDFRILATSGLSEIIKEQGVEEDKSFELFFCLPSYWLLEELENPRFNWVINWLFRFSDYLVKNKTFFDHGHTIAAGNPPEPLSETMKQTYFMFSEPIATAPLFKGQLEGKKYLAVIPLFQDEFDYKVAKGTFKLEDKFRQKGNSEVLDDFRTSSVRKKYYIF